MRKMILLLVFLSMFLLAWGARKEGFFPYPADPVTIVIQSTNRLVGAGYPGSANGPPPSSSTFSENLYGYDLSHKPCADDIAPLGNGENVRDVKCWEYRDNVPFFGSGAPRSGDTIWVAYWRSPNDSIKPSSDTHYLINAAYASYGACWLATKRQSNAEYATYLADSRARTPGEPCPMTAPQLQCSALKNPNGK